MTTVTNRLATSASVVEQLRMHIADSTTDLADGTWAEPVANYLSASRYAAELAVLRSVAVPFCPGGALPEPGSYVTRTAAGIPIVAVRGADGVVRGFRNACRHRGAAVACGAGHAASFVCPYHGWVYQLDGHLRRVSHEHGFPGLDLESNGLVPVAAFERHGLVFVDQEGDGVPAPEIDELNGVVTDAFHYVGCTEALQPVNWKVLVETFLEGYHIRFLHHSTFFPVQYDNLNVVEQFGPNSRVTFPFRNIERPFDTDDPMAVRGRLTYVHHMFPNVVVVTFPGQVLMIVLDPVALDSTTMTTYSWRQSDDRVPPSGPQLLNDGGAEDFAVARTVQAGLSSGANDNLQFGRFEGAIAHFHRTLDAALGQAGWAGDASGPSRRDPFEATPR